MEQHDKQPSFFEKYWWCIAILLGLAYCSSVENKNSTHSLAGHRTYVETTSTGATHDVTIRDEEPPVEEDDPDTTNDESNDKPVGFYGTQTMRVYSQESGNTYTLDIDVDEDGQITQIYFPKGGWLTFTGCYLDDDHNATCVDDENSSTWEFSGQ